MMGMLEFLILVVSVALVSGFYTTIMHGNRKSHMIVAGIAVVFALLVWVRMNLHEHQNGTLIVLENTFNHTRTMAYFTDPWYQYPLFIERMDKEAEQ